MPAQVVGGDFFEAFGIDAGRVFIAVGDVAGKGISAALFMARSLATLRLEVLSGRPYETLMPRFNEALCEHNAHSTFVTLFAGFVDIQRGQLTYFSAGHHASLLMSADGTVTALPRPEGLVAGAIAGADYALAHHPLQAGDMLIAFSDGVTEAQNLDKQFFGQTGVLAALSAARPPTARAALTAIQEAVRRFTGAAPQFDDITVLALRMIGGPSNSDPQRND
jgi:sigma-B regulation protein RsbU (phosphoserine phosphatase)